MSIEIKMPGYKTLISGSTYGRKAEDFAISISGRALPTMELFQVSTHRIPLQAEILADIQCKSREFNHLSSQNPDSQSDRDLIKEVFESFSKENLRRIQEGDKMMSSHLEKHVPCELNDLAGVVYFNAAGGIVPSLILDKLMEQIKRGGHLAYTDIIEDFGEKDWYFKTVLNNNSFPDRSEMDYLLDREVRECRLFRADGEYGSYRRLASYVRLLYNTFDSPEKINEVKDFSRAFLSNTSIVTLHRAAKCPLGINHVKENLEEIVEESKGDDRSTNNDGQTLPRFRGFSLN